MKSHFSTALVLVGCLACGRASDSPTPGVASRSEAPSLPPVAAETEPFLEQAQETGLVFEHDHGGTGEFYFCEIAPGGAALLDYDRDGDLDVFLAQGHPLPSVASARRPGDGLENRSPLRGQLFRNDLEPRPDGGSPRFTPVTEASRLQANGYGMGAVAADYDNDGWTDLYVTTWGSPNQLFRNRGDGTFEEVGSKAGVDDRRWSISAAFFDYDRDGWLDLFVAHYVDFTFAKHNQCTNSVGLPDYCGPLAFRPVPDALYRNRGDGTFEDVTVKAGLDQATAGNGLGVVTADFDDDGWPDIYVANDQVANHLWMNRGDGSFREEGLLSGSALNEEGDAQASMGVDAGDVDGDGDEDLFMAHLDAETNTLYANEGRGGFADRTRTSGLGVPSWEYTGFGAGFLDYDNDGWLDLLVVNGAVRAIHRLVVAGDPYPFHQRNQLFRNVGGGRFEEVRRPLGAAFELSEVSRGAAFGDLDNDGDTDVVIHNNQGPARLLVNQVGQDRGWIGVRLLGGPGPRDMLGAQVELHRPGHPALVRRVRTEGSYASSRDPRLLFGLGEWQDVARVLVTWPDGSVEEWRDLAGRRYHTLRQGEGTLVTPSRS